MTPRRLRLSRSTLRVLGETALGAARGGGTEDAESVGCGESGARAGCGEPDSKHCTTDGIRCWNTDIRTWPPPRDP